MNKKKKNNPSRTIHMECDSCNGTGLYQGFCEGKNHAVICLQCNGKGWITFKYREFTHRKKKRGIKTVSRSRGAFIQTGVGSDSPPMSYKQFEMLVPAVSPPKTE